MELHDVSERGPGEKRKYAYLAPFHLPTGFAQAARENLKALDRAGLSICGKDTALPNLSFFLKKELVLTDHAMNELTDDRPEYAGPFEGFLLHTTGDAIRHMGQPTLAHLVWEVERLPDGWAERANQTDAIFTPSEFSKRLFVDGGVTKPIYVVPHPIDLTIYHPDVKPVVSIERPDTVFLTVAQWMPRKGLEDVLLAYLTEFKEDESVALILFVWGGSHGLMERENIKERIRRLRDGLNIGGTPKIWYIGENIPREAIPEIYALADVHVSASRGEAFSLPVFEAAACAKPTVMTGYGGAWNYLDDDSAYRVEYDMEPAHGVGGNWKHYNARQLWARARIMSLRQQMRRAHEDKTERERMGQRALEVVIDNMTHDKVGNEMKVRFLDHVEAKVGV